MNIDALRAQLRSELQELEAELARHGKPVGDREDNWTGTSEIGDADRADRSVVADEIERLVENVSIVETLERRYREIERALEKMNTGGYGICEVCAEPIPSERLKANPAALTCINHVDTK